MSCLLEKLKLAAGNLQRVPRSIEEVQHTTYYYGLCIEEASSQDKADFAVILMDQLRYFEGRTVCDQVDALSKHRLYKAIMRLLVSISKCTKVTQNLCSNGCLGLMTQMLEIPEVCIEACNVLQVVSTAALRDDVVQSGCWQGLCKALLSRPDVSLAACKALTKLYLPLTTAWLRFGPIKVDKYSTSAEDKAMLQLAITNLHECVRRCTTWQTTVHESEELLTQALNLLTKAIDILRCIAADTPQGPDRWQAPLNTQILTLVFKQPWWRSAVPSACSLLHATKAALPEYLRKALLDYVDIGLPQPRQVEQVEQGVCSKSWVEKTFEDVEDVSSSATASQESRVSTSRESATTNVNDATNAKEVKKVKAVHTVGRKMSAEAILVLNTLVHLEFDPSICVGFCTDSCSKDDMLATATRVLANTSSPDALQAAADCIWNLAIRSQHTWPKHDEQTEQCARSLSNAMCRLALSCMSESAASADLSACNHARDLLQKAHVASSSIARATWAFFRARGQSAVKAFVEANGTKNVDSLRTSMSAAFRTSFWLLDELYDICQETTDSEAANSSAREAAAKEAQITATQEKDHAVQALKDVTAKFEEKLAARDATIQRQDAKLTDMYKHLSTMVAEASPIISKEEV